MIAGLAACSPRECFISSITEFELFQGAARAPSDQRASEHAKVERFVSCLRVLPFDSSCARAAADLNSSVLKRGTPISITDVFIAATGLARGWTVVSSRTRDFRRVAGLLIEDWR